MRGAILRQGILFRKSLRSSEVPLPCLQHGCGRNIVQDFNAIILRSGDILHLPWGSHTQIVDHYGVPENTSTYRQNYWEYDILPPFVDGGGLQARGIEEPPEQVLATAARLTDDLCNWHAGRRLRSIPPDWSDVVEHIYQIRGRRTPAYLNGRAGVYFSCNIDHLSDVRIVRLIGSARIGRLDGASVVASMSGQSHIEELAGDAVIQDVRERASIGKMTGRCRIEILCQSGIVQSMHDSSRVTLMHGASRILSLHDQATCARGCDGTVFTADLAADHRALLESESRYRSVQLIASGEPVYA